MGLSCGRTAGALVEEEEATRETDGAGQTKDLGESSLSDVRGGKLLEGQHGRRRKGGRQAAYDVIRRPSIAQDTLEMPIPIASQ